MTCRKSASKVDLPVSSFDTKLSTPLFDLPLGAIASSAPPTSLAARNLLRHLTWKLPSGQQIAAAMGAPVLTAAQLADLEPIYPPFVTSTPLWFYILREADILGGGAHLGPVGGRIVAEVFIGLLQTDPDFVPESESAVLARPGRHTRGVCDDRLSSLCGGCSQALTRNTRPTDAQARLC